MKILGQLLSVFLGDGFLDGLGSVVNQVLGFLQAQAGHGTDDLDDVQLGSAGGLQDDVELGLLFHFDSTGSGTGGDSGGSGGDTEGLLEGMNQLGQLEHGQILDFLNEGSDLFRHFNILHLVVVGVDKWDYSAGTSAGAGPAFCWQIWSRT